MSVEEKIAKVRNKAANLAVKVAAVTLLGGAGMATSCSENNRDTDENGNKIENVEGEKTSVVFRATHNSSKYGRSTDILFEDGTSIISNGIESRFLEPGDTVTYEKSSDNIYQHDVKAVRYKGGQGKQVNFGKIGKVGKDRTD